MASIFLKRIQERYGKENIKKGRYGRIVREILSENNTRITNRVNRLTSENYRQSLKGISKKTAKTMKLPTTEDVIPKRILLLKAGQNGKFISDSLRKQLERNLRESLSAFDATGENRMEIQRGKATGKINPELIKDFQQRIKQSFISRTKKDPETGVPGNVRNIAVTEIRSVIDETKDIYASKLEEMNPNLIMTKTWKHNRQLSKKPRQGHIAMNNITIPKKDKFKVPRETNGFDYMDRPHDPDAIIEQTAGCSCDIIYKAQIRE